MQEPQQRQQKVKKQPGKKQPVRKTLAMRKKKPKTWKRLVLEIPKYAEIQNALPQFVSPSARSFGLSYSDVVFGDGLSLKSKSTTLEQCAVEKKSPGAISHYNGSAGEVILFHKLFVSSYDQEAKLIVNRKNAASQENLQKVVPQETNQQISDNKKPGKSSIKCNKRSRLVLRSESSKRILELPKAPNKKQKVNLQPSSISTPKYRHGILFSELFRANSSKVSKVSSNPGPFTSQQISLKHSSINKNKKSDKEMPSMSKAVLKPPLCRPEKLSSNVLFGDGSSSMLKLKTIAPRRSSNTAQNEPMNADGVGGESDGNSINVKTPDKMDMDKNVETCSEYNKECEMCEVIKAIEQTTINGNNTNSNVYDDFDFNVFFNENPFQQYFSQFNDENYLRLEKMAVEGVINMMRNR